MVGKIEATTSMTLAREATPDGKELILHRRDGVYSLRVDGLELMSSRAHGSEDALARLACDGLASSEMPRVLIGGLGFGYTLRSALENLPNRATVVVSEIFASLLDWHRQLVIGLAGRALEDSRVQAVHADVWDVLGESEPFDAIILDVDNGPWALTMESNERLYREDGLRRLAESLTKRGKLAVWSAEDAPDFEHRLRRTGFEVDTKHVPARGAGEPVHSIILGVRP